VKSLLEESLGKFTVSISDRCHAQKSFCMNMFLGVLDGNNHSEPSGAYTGIFHDFT
jgi:hypothetical protein